MLNQVGVYQLHSQYVDIGAGQKPHEASLANKLESCQAPEAMTSATKHAAPMAAGHESETGASLNPAAASTAGDEGGHLDEHWAKRWQIWDQGTWFIASVCQREAPCHLTWLHTGEISRTQSAFLIRIDVVIGHHVEPNWPCSIKLVNVNDTHSAFKLTGAGQKPPYATHIVASCSNVTQQIATSGNVVLIWARKLIYWLTFYLFEADLKAMQGFFSTESNVSSSPSTKQSEKIEQKEDRLQRIYAALAGVNCKSMWTSHILDWYCHLFFSKVCSSQRIISLIRIW